MSAMKTIDEIRRDNLAIAVARFGGANKLAEAANVSAAYLSQVKNSQPASGSGKPKKLGDDVARKIEDALGERTGWMDTDHSEAQPRHATIPADQGNVLTWESPEDLPPDPDRVWLDRFDYRFSAGTGLIQWEVRQKKALPFDIGFFKSLGSKPKDCKLLQVHGDSMEPYLFDRDMIMVDVAKTSIRDGRVYAIHFEDEPLVKQILKQAGGAIILRSINSSKYPDKYIPPELMDSLTIMGEVIYRSGSGWAGGN